MDSPTFNAGYSATPDLVVEIVSNQRAEHAEQLLTEQRRRAERLAALLRRSGIDPEQD